MTLVFSGCWNCGELRTKLKSVQLNQHRHCPKCDYLMDYSYKGWDYGRHWRLAYECSKCDLIISVSSAGTDYGKNQVYGYGWTMDSVITNGFLKAQKERIGFKHLDDDGEGDQDDQELESKTQTKKNFHLVETDGSIKEIKIGLKC